MNPKKNKIQTFFEDPWSTLKRAFEEFLAVPTILIFCFLMLAVASYYVEYKDFEWIKPFQSFMRQHIFSDSKATSELLGAIAGSIITVSSLTITLLLVVVQQSAASMTTQVFDQFLRSRNNQLIFGFFVGLSLFSLIILSTVSSSFNPVIGATIALFFTFIALFLLIILVYSTINEMRPPVIIESIHQLILNARGRQAKLLNRTRRMPSFDGQVNYPIALNRHGYLTGINLEGIGKCAKSMPGETEIIYEVSIGDYLSVHDVFATVTGNNMEDCKKMAGVVYKSTLIELQRNTASDPADGIEQLEMIGWTSISTSKSNPYPGLLTIRALRNLLSQWKDEKITNDKIPFPVVYNDNVKERLLSTLETMGVVASESMQHQSFTEVIHTFNILFERMDTEIQQRMEDIVLRLLSALGDFVLTGPLDKELTQLVSLLNLNNRNETANFISKAQVKLRESIGHLNSRATRV